MLSLAPPYHVVDGVSLLPDHADPLQFYYLPLAPHLTTVAGMPQLQVVLYTGATASGGFLNFDCNLGIDAKRLEALTASLQETLQSSGTPKLAPVPLIDGTVRMVLLGKESPPAEAERPRTGGAATPPAPVGPQFVLKIQHHGKPSLYGENQASFSVQLDPEGVTILEQAIRGEISPIGVVYSLSYVGLRPAYSVRVSADWDRVQKHVSESESVSTIFYSSDVDKIVDELIESRAIVIEADTFVAAGEGDDAVIGRAAEALDQVREMVTEAFFEPSLEPITDEEPGGDFAGTVERLSFLATTGGMGSVFTRKEVDITRIDRKRLNVNLSERTAVIRQINPQGHLAGLFDVLRQPGVDPARFILRVGLDNPFFQRRTVRVIPYVDFGAAADQPDRVQSMSVSLTYEGQTQDVVFDAAHPAEQAVSWASVLDGEAMRRDVTATCTVNFAPTPAFGRPASVQVPLEIEQGDALTIQPRGTAYDVRPIVISSVDFPFATWGTVEVELAYADPAHGIEQHQQLIVRQDTAEQLLWPVFAMDAALRTVRYRMRFHGVDGRDVDGGWQETTEDLVRIADPFPRKRTVAIVAPTALFGTQVDRAFVDVRYDDPANGVSKHESYELNAADASTRTFQVELVDPARRQVAFRATFLMTDGRTIEVPESTTDAERIMLRPDMKGHRAVAVRCEPRDFALSGLREILVEARYEDTAAQLSYADDVRFTRAGETAAFEFDFVDAAKDAYRYRITHQYLSGLSKATDWVESDAPDVLVPVN